MQRKQLAELVADIAGKPLSTIENGLIPKLQSAGVIPWVKSRDGSEIDASYRVTVLLAAAIPSGYGVAPGEAVRFWRSLPMVAPFYRSDDGPKLSMEEKVRCAVQFLEGLGIKFDTTLGEVLDGIVESMQSGAFQKWVQVGDVSVSASFHDTHYAALAIDRPQFGKGVILYFGPEKGETPAVQRVVQINRAAFERLAA